MDVKFRDVVDCEISFESESEDEKELLRKFYFKMTDLNKLSQVQLIERMVNDNG